MKFIELTGRQLGKLILLNLNNCVTINENSGGFTSVYCVDNHKIQVRETPREIADLINGVEKPKLEWIKNTGKAPPSGTMVELRMIANASKFSFRQDAAIPVTYYRILGEENE